MSSRCGWGRARTRCRNWPPTAPARSTSSSSTPTSTNTAAYFAWALKLTRRGSLIITDNVVRDGAVIDAASTQDANVQGVRRFIAALAAEPRVNGDGDANGGQQGL